MVLFACEVSVGSIWILVKLILSPSMAITIRGDILINHIFQVKVQQFNVNTNDELDTRMQLRREIKEKSSTKNHWNYIIKTRGKAFVSSRCIFKLIPSYEFYI